MPCADGVSMRGTPRLMIYEARTPCPRSGSVLLCVIAAYRGNGDTASRPVGSSVGAAGRIVPEGSARGSMMIVRAVH
jgi:hypothetical protein